MQRSSAVTALVSPKLLVTPFSVTLATMSSVVHARPDSASRFPVKDRKPRRVERETDRLSNRKRSVGRHTRLDKAIRGFHRHDLRRAEIFGAIDRATKFRSVVKPDVLRPNSER